MTWYNKGAAIAAVVLFALLAIVTIGWIRHTGVVRPTVSVIPAPPTPNSRGDSSVASETLAARTRLQADETNKLPALETREGNEGLIFRRSPPVAEARVREWQRSGDGGGIATPSQDHFGLSSLPYANSNVLEQPDGRDWRTEHNSPLRFGGGWMIFGVALALALFLFRRGRIRIAEGRDGQTVERFNAIERTNHWMTATSFVLMAVTGLVILYGKPLLLPLVGEHALGSIAWWSAWLHMGSAIPFVLGIVTMAFLWLRENVITRLDVEWLRRFGGFLDDSPEKPSAQRFNGGQKFVFWLVLIGGVGALATGLTLMFPFRWVGYDGMQWAQLLHAGIGLAMIGLIIGHIYIGTVGMEGAIDAMWSGRVDKNWAKEHHDLWYADAEKRAKAGK